MPTIEMNASEWPPMQEGGGENLALMEKDSLPRRRPGRTRISYHKKVTSVATKGGEESGLRKEPHRPDKYNGLHRSPTRRYIASATRCLADHHNCHSERTSSSVKRSYIPSIQLRYACTNWMVANPFFGRRPPRSSRTQRAHRPGRFRSCAGLRFWSAP